jgi:hypothetical protein
MTSTNYCFSFWPTGWVTMERRSLSAPYRRTYVLTVRFRAVDVTLEILRRARG